MVDYVDVPEVLGMEIIMTGNSGQKEKYCADCGKQKGMEVE